MGAARMSKDWSDSCDVWVAITWTPGCMGTSGLRQMVGMLRLDSEIGHK